MNLPMYIPSGCVYQTGYVYTDIKTGAQDVVEMGRPFRIGYGKEKSLNFNSHANGGYIFTPANVALEYVSHTEPKYGKLTKTDSDLTYTYTPDVNQLEDSFDMTVKLTVKSGKFAGVAQTVTYRIGLLQETGYYNTSFYKYSTTTGNETAIEEALKSNILDREPDYQTIALDSGLFIKRESRSKGSIALVFCGDECAQAEHGQYLWLKRDKMSHRQL